MRSVDDNNFFSKRPGHDEPPPPGSEDDYGLNVVPLKGRKKMKGDPTWKDSWQLTETGQPIPNLLNVMITLRNHPRLLDLLRFDEMAQSAMLMQQIPNTPHDPTIPRIVRDADVLAIQEEIQLTGLRRVAKATVQDAVQLRAEQERFHPVKDYLTALVWDGTPRVDRWLSYYLGAEPSPAAPPEEQERKRDYIAKIGRLFLIAMVARPMRPGCKADYMLILEGPQGALKSSACHVLAGKWFSDSLPDLSKGDAVRLSMHLRGKWLIEIAEMSSFNAAESHRLKEFLTQTEEQYTPKFGRNEVQEPRQCLFIGSTNEGTYLRDSTGARRFWPVAVGKIDLEALEADRDQLFAEAMVLLNQGEPWWPDADFEKHFIKPEQAARYETDVWESEIERWLIRDYIVECTVTQVLKDAVNMSTQNMGTREQRRVSAIMLQLGWSRNEKNSRRPYVRPEGWRQNVPHS